MTLTSPEESSSNSYFSRDHSKRKVASFDDFGFCYLNVVFVHCRNKVDDEFCPLLDVVESLKSLKPKQRACVHREVVASIRPV